MSDFTPVAGLIGGSLIGAGAGILLLLNGNIMGYSSVMSSSFLHPVSTFEKNPWKLTFLANFSWAATVYIKYIDPTCLERSLNNSNGGPSTLALVVSGFLVGFGTKLGNGCTSGHGICGLARFSKRSLVNVVCFMTTGALTTFYLNNNTLGESNPFRLSSTQSTPIIHAEYGMLFTLMTILAAMPNLSDKKTLGASLSGAISCFGLAMSGMIDWRKIQGFLNVSILWKGDASFYDGTLICVLASGVVVSFLSYQFLAKYTFFHNKNKCLSKPILADTTIDTKLVLGGMIFGVGWGLGCYCPGPALFHLAVGSEGVMLYWMPSFVGGAYLAEQVVSILSSSNKNNKVDTKKTS